MNKYKLKEKLITIGLCEDNEWSVKILNLKKTHILKILCD